MAAELSPTRHAWHGLILSVVLSVVGYLVTSLWGGWHDVTGAIARVGWRGTGVMLALSGVNYLLRFGRWQLYLARLGHRISWGSSFVIYLSGFALTTTPGKAGEAIRGLFLKPHGVSYRTSLAAFFSERLSDLLAIVLLATLGLSRYPFAWPLLAVGALAVLALLLLMGQVRWLTRVESALAARAGRLSRILLTLFQLLIAARRCHTPRMMMLTTGLSLVAWGAEAYAFHLALGWLGLDVDVGFAVFTYAIAMLAGALSFLPGGLGSAEAAMITLLLWLGLPQASTVASTVLIRLTTLWFAVALGLIALGALIRRRSASTGDAERRNTPA